MKKALIPSFLFTALVGSFWVAEASAHARWSQDGTTPGRSNNANLKAGPCGNVPRSDTPAVFKTGQTITLNWESTIYHKGYFRISFSKAGDTDFEQMILLDNIPERDGPPGPYSAEVTLPDEPCEGCTLQMIQVMLDRDPPTNYYSCADIQVVADDAPVDTTPPAAVAAVELVNNRLQWQNPTDDFAGVLLLTSTEANFGEPQPGTFYSAGDVLGAASVAYVGQGEGFDVSGAGAFRLYAFDLAGNYSTAEHHDGVIAEPEHYFDFGLEYEQLGNMAEGVFTADGDVLIQAAVELLNTPQGGSAGEVTLTLGDAQNAVVITEQATHRWAFDPADFAGQSLTLDVTGIDAKRPSQSLVRSLTMDVMPYSSYKPQVVFYQSGKVITHGAATDAGDITVQIEFEGAEPSNVSDWRAQWSDTGVEGAVVSANGMALRFTPQNKSANLSFEVEVFSATAPAAPLLNRTLTVNKTIILGAWGTGWLLLLTVLGLIGRVRLQARP